jgi:hypothetical protein
LESFEWFEWISIDFRVSNWWEFDWKLFNNSLRTSTNIQFDFYFQSSHSLSTFLKTSEKTSQEIQNIATKHKATAKKKSIEKSSR